MSGFPHWFRPLANCKEKQDDTPDKEHRILCGSGAGTMGGPLWISTAGKLLLSAIHQGNPPDHIVGAERQGSSQTGNRSAPARQSVSDRGGGGGGGPSTDPDEDYELGALSWRI